jgi:hypothetical protein
VRYPGTGQHARTIILALLPLIAMIFAIDQVTRISLFAGGRLFKITILKNQGAGRHNPRPIQHLRILNNDFVS